MRKLLFFAFGILAVVAVVFSVVLLLGEARLVNHTVECSRKIERGFRQTGAYIDEFRATHDRLPSRGELTEWTSRFPHEIDSSREFELETRAEMFPKEAVKKFGSAPQGSYLLSYWRGEWTEYYASWANKSTV